MSSCVPACGSDSLSTDSHIKKVDIRANGVHPHAPAREQHHGCRTPAHSLRCPAVVVSCIDIHSRRHTQYPDNFNVATPRSPRKRSQAFLVFRINLNPSSVYE